MTDDVERVLEWLRDHGSQETLSGMARYGIPAVRAFGIPMRVMKAYAKELGTHHPLALSLWDTGWYEARTVAVFIADTAELTREEMDRWAADFDSWAICDTACFHLFDRSDWAWSSVARWATAEPEFNKRAAFALLWGLSVHDKASGEAPFLDGLRWIDEGARDERLYVKKAVNMALRAVGKRSKALNEAACELARRLVASDEATPVWIGRHALRELESSRVQARLG